MGISAMTALEIFTNRNDLYILLKQERSKENGKWGFAICRGPGHSYKLLVYTKDYPFDTVEKAVVHIEKIFRELFAFRDQPASSENSGELFSSLFAEFKGRTDCFDESYLDDCLACLRQNQHWNSWEKEKRQNPGVMLAPASQG